MLNCRVFTIFCVLNYKSAIEYFENTIDDKYYVHRCFTYMMQWYTVSGKDKCSNKSVYNWQCWSPGGSRGLAESKNNFARWHRIYLPCCYCWPTFQMFILEHSAQPPNFDFAIISENQKQKISVLAAIIIAVAAACSFPNLRFLLQPSFMAHFYRKLVVVEY